MNKRTAFYWSIVAVLVMLAYAITLDDLFG